MAHFAATHAEARGLSQRDQTSTTTTPGIDQQRQQHQQQQSTAWQQHRPSPLHETVSAGPNDIAASHSLHSSHTQRFRAHSDLQASAPLPRTQSLRTPRPAKKVAANPELDEIKAAVERDALRKEAKKAAQSSSQSRQRTTPEPDTAANAANVFTSSPPASPGTMSSAATATRAIRADTAGDIMARAGSLDSTVSAESSGASNSKHKHKHSGSTSSTRVQPEQARPEDVAALIAAAGSPDAAIVKLITEKNAAASHNSQLWRLVEKQRAMIMSLNKDLERVLKEKERYRRKLKENLAPSQSAPVLSGALQHVEADNAREMSQSPQPVHTISQGLRDASLEGRKSHEASDLNSAGPGRSDTPLGSINLPSSGLPSTPQSVGGLAGGESGFTSKDAPVNTTGDARPNAPKPLQLSSNSLAMQESRSVVSPALSPPGTATSFSTKNATRKAPPAPLQLSPMPTPAAITNNIMDPSDSEYEDDPEGTRDEHTGRGRRRTREQDDREREAIAQKELESRSKSKREKSSKSKSKSKPPTEATGAASENSRSVVSAEVLQEPAAQPRKAVEVLPDDPVAILRSRAASDATRMLQKSVTAPSLMSPGLPMSPRPGDRPMNSPMPRAPNKVLNSIPMSPKAGLPFSPRAPNKAIPMPPQTPLTITSPHLARAEQYQQQMMLQPSIADRLKPRTQPSSEWEQAVEPKTPGEIYRGLVTEQYPDLLLPPNALPSVYMKVASSRMRPSRNSYIAPKHADENPVFTVGIHARSDNKQLWRVEKTLASLGALDQQIKSVCVFRDRVPDKALFAGHAPARIDARRVALDTYFNNMVDAITDERAARVVCRFLSTDAIAAEEGGDYFGKPAEPRPDSPITKVRPRREGYLTKRGKNFGGWKARYFVLDGPQLKYFEAPGGAHLGSIKLQSAQIGKQSQQSNQTGEDEDNQFRHAFLVLEPKRKDSNALVRHVLCAESDEERDAWVEALLTYVDWADGEDSTAYGQGVKPDMSAVRSPRLQKSLNDLRPASRGKENSRTRYDDAMQSIGYNDTVAGDAPVMGDRPIIGTKNAGQSPSPNLNGDLSEQQPAANHPTISGPKNATIIQNAGDWGMKVPPTPGLAKKEKRGLFAGFRGRSSSDLDTREKIMSPGLPPGDAGIRAVFGVPLAEAVEFSRPAGVVTDLPAVVYRCIEYLTLKKAIAEEGIFRLSGSNTVIKALRERFNTEGDVNLAADGKYYDVHAVASLLKLYLRELPSSVLTRDLHLEFLHCLEMPHNDKVVSLNVLAHRLPKVNYELLKSLSAFLLSIVNAAEINKMNVRNVGIVFSPTLNVPAPLISSFVENQADIFGAAIDEAESPLAERELNIPASISAGGAPIDLRSPRKQMFTDLPTPAYNQTTFQSFSALHSDARNGAGGAVQQHQQHDTSDTGFAPIHPTYAGYQIAPQGDGGFSSLNGALLSPTSPAPPAIYSTAANGTPTPRDVRQKHRESGMYLLSPGLGASGGAAGAAGGAGGVPQKKPSMKRLGENEGASF